MCRRRDTTQSTHTRGSRENVTSTVKEGDDILRGKTSQEEYENKKKKTLRSSSSVSQNSKKKQGRLNR
jgi:hypothetical protein